MKVCPVCGNEHEGAAVECVRCEIHVGDENRTADYDLFPENTPFAGQSLTTFIAHTICESPIEVAFFLALVKTARECSVTTVLCVGLTGTGPSATYPLTRDFGTGTLLEIHPQVKTAVGRLDFLLAMGNEHVHSGGLVVECDGHEFHERTKEQAMRDRSRDRRLQTAGARVFRYTGRELHQDADHCASQSLRFLQQALAAKGEVAVV